MEIDNRLKQIADHFGLPAQAEKAIEEMAELIVEIKHLRKASGNDVSFYEELADVKIMIDQLVYLVKQDKDAAEYFDYQTNFKIGRTLRRIEAEGEAK